MQSPVGDGTGRARRKCRGWPRYVPDRVIVIPSAYSSSSTGTAAWMWCASPRGGTHGSGRAGWARLWALRVPVGFARSSPSGLVPLFSSLLFWYLECFSSSAASGYEWIMIMSGRGSCTVLVLAPLFFSFSGGSDNTTPRLCLVPMKKIL